MIGGRIIKLFNPRGVKYNNFKKKVLACNFKWEYLNDTLDFGEDEEVADTIQCLTPEQKKEKNWGKFPMYNNCILQRAEAPIAAIGTPLYFPTLPEANYASQQLAMEASMIVQDILKANRIKLNMIFRMHLNAVDPQPDGVRTGWPHTDHEYPHYNLLLYLTDAGGDTFIMQDDYKYDNYTPNEDDCVIFEGVHFHETPKEKRRVVFVCTYA